MGLNAKEIPVRFCRMIQVSIETSFTLMRRHPLISGVLILLLIVYLFLSYIYHFLVYLSPFLVCTAIFIRIFWSSEQGQLKYIKGDEKKGEQRKFDRQFTKMPSYGRRDLLLERRYSLGNATSRRRNFKDKKWDVQDIVVEEKVKVLPTITSNDSENKDAKSSEKEESSSDYAEKFQDPDTQSLPLQSELPISDLVKSYDSEQQNSKLEGSGGSALEKENSAEGEGEGEGEESQEEEGEESQEEEEESQEETNKAVEWTKDDQKNLMDLGISEIERNRRLESLIARRRARQHIKLQIEKGLIDIRTVSPSQIAPLLIARTNTFDSPRDYEGIDGLDIPGSAPSVMRPSRNPFDLPYDPSEEKPNLTGDSFQQEFTTGHQREMPFSRHESFSLGPSLPFEESYPFFINGRKISDRFRRLPDKGNHDLIIEKLFSKDGDAGIGFSTGVKAPKPLLTKEERKIREETTNQEDTKLKTGMTNMKEEEDETAQETEPMSDHKSESDSVENSSHWFPKTDHKISNDQKSEVSEKPEEPRTLDKPSEKFLNFPITSSTSTSASPFDSFASPSSKNQENLLFSEKCIFHKPTCSIASDLQVEFSEVGSPTLTIDEESVVYDGDIDKEIIVTPRSEDLGGALFSSRASEEDIADVSNSSSKSIASLIPLQQIDEEEDAADLPGDTPTHAKMNYDYNIFCNMKKAEVETEPSQPSSSSDVSSPHQTQPEKTEERQNLSENSRTDSTAIDVQNSNRNEDPEPSIVHQESIDAVSVSSFPLFSPRSVLPEKTLTIQVSSPASDQQIRTNIPQLNIAQTTNELPPNTMPQPLMVDPINQTHSGASSNSQEASCSSTVADDSNTTYKLGKKPIFDDEDGMENNTLIIPRNKKISSEENDAEEDKLKKGETSEDKSTSVVREEDDIISPTLAEMKAMEDSNNKSRKVVDDEVTSSPSKVTEKIGNSTATEDAKVATELVQSVDVNPPKPDKLNESSERVSNVQSESKKSDAEIIDKVEDKEKLKNDISTKPDKLNGSSEKVSNVQSESKKSDAEISKKVEDKEMLKNDISTKPDKPNGSSEKVSNVQSESKKSDAEIINKVEDKEKLKNDISTKLEKPNDSSENLSNVRSESRKGDAEISNKEEIKEKLNNEVPSKTDKANSSSEKVSNVQSESKKNDKVISNKEEDKEKSKIDTPPKPDNANDSSEKEAPCSSTEASISSGTSPVQSKLLEDNDTSIIPGNKELANPLENSDGGAKISGMENDTVVCKIEDKQKLKNSENSKDKLTSVIRQDDATKSPTSSEMTALEDKDNKSRKVVDNELTSSPLKVTEKIGNSTASKDDKTTGELAQEEVSNVHSKSGKNDAESSNKEEIKEKSKNEVPPKPDKANDSSEKMSNVNSEPKKNDAEISNTEEVKENLKDETPSKLDKPNDTSGKVSSTDRESKKTDAVIRSKEEVKDKLNNDTPSKLDKPNDSSEKEKAINVESGLKKNDAEIGNKKEDKEKSKNEVPLKPDNKPNDSSEEVSNVHSESKNNGAEISNKEEIKEKVKNDTQPKLEKPNSSSGKVSDVHIESKKNDVENGNKEEDKEKSKNDIPSKPSKPNDSPEDVSNLHSESKKNDAEISNKEEDKEKLRNDTPRKPDKPNDSTEKESDVHCESKKNEAEISNKEEIKEKLKNDTPPKPDRPKDSSEQVSGGQSESKKNDAENSNKEDVKETLKNDIPSKPIKANDSSEKVSNMQKEPREVEDDMEKDRLASGNIAKANEVTRSSSAKDTEANKNKVIEQESNQHEG